MDVLLDNDNVSQTVVVTGGVRERDEVQARLEVFFAEKHPDNVTRVSPLEVGPPVGWPIRFQEVDENIGRGEDPWGAIIHASTPRARPIVLTALAAMLGMVPIAFQIFRGPMAFAIIGGLAVATIATLLLLPCLLLWLLLHEQRGRAVEASAEVSTVS